MKDALIKAAGFIVTFIVAVLLFSRYMNRGSSDMTVDMSQASFPVLNIMISESPVNPLHGYPQAVDLARFRGPLTPLHSDRTLAIRVNRYGAEISSLYYEVRSLDGARLIEKTDVEEFQAENDQITASFQIKDLIEKNEEYYLCIVLNDTNGKEFRYYTRMIYDPDFHTGEMVSFVRDFTVRTFNKESAAGIAPYLESDSTGNNTSYANVNIHSSFGQITWGDLSPKLLTGIETLILEMDSKSASFLQQYEVEAGPEDQRYQYSVKEYFRIRYSSERMYLLEYERTMNEIFIPDRAHFINDKIMLGIHEPELEMKENAEGDVLAFVLNGALYCYRKSDARIVRIFSFTDDDNRDERSRYTEHDIRVLTVDEGGNIRFLVYGYMNRGRHEGEVCACVYYYDRSFNTIEEEICIPYLGSYQIFRRDLELLAYSDRNSHFYLYFDGSIYRVLLDSHQAERIADGIGMDDIVSSESGRTAAWVNRPKEFGTAGVGTESKAVLSTITLIDLESGRSRILEADEGSIYTPIGFVGEDFVYGISGTEDLIRTTTGAVRYAMHTIMIESREGEVLKEYNGSGAYISDVAIEGNTIRLSRIVRSPETGRFEQIEDDQIMSGDQEAGNKNKIVIASTENRENITEIQLTDTVDTESLQFLTPKEVLFEGGRKAELEGRGGGIDLREIYFVYAKGRIPAAFSEAAEAVAFADRESGVVIYDAGKYVWRKGVRDVEHSVEGIKTIAEEILGRGGSDQEICLNTMISLEGGTPLSEEELSGDASVISVLSEHINKPVLDLEGCSLDEILYYVGQDTPVLAAVEEGSVLITGYDTKNISVLDPQEGDIHKIGLGDSRELFSQNGNGFITYLTEDAVSQ